MERHYRNQAILVLDATLFGLTLGVLDINTVVPSLVAPLSSSPGLIVGIAVLIKQTLFLLPQVLVVLLHKRLTNLPGFIWTMYLTDRLLLCGVLIAVMSGSSAATGMIFFITWFAVFNLAEGIVQVPWMNLYATAVPSQNRGPLFGASILAVSIGSLLLAPLVSANASLPYPTGMTRLLGLTAVLLGPILLFFRRIDVRHSTPRSDLQGSVIGNWKRLLRNPNVPRVSALQGCLTVGSVFFPFYFLLAQDVTELSVSTLVMASIAGSAVGGVAYGAISRYLGNRVVLQIVGATGLTGGLLCSAGVFLPNPSNAIIIAGFALAGSCASGWLGYYNYLFELTSEDKHILLLSLVNALLLPLTLTAPYIGDEITRQPSVWWSGIQVALFAVAILLAFRLEDPSGSTKECQAS